jgi:thiol-disulfide isomerase/thioredoxin
MKIQILIPALLLAATSLFAQTHSTTTRGVIRRTLDEHTIVRDTAGNLYPFAVWHDLSLNGDYMMKPKQPMKDGKPNEDPDMEYILVPYTAAQKEAMKARLGKPAESPYFTTGESIKPFKIKDITGKKVDVKDWAGKTIVLNFWFVACVPCRSEMPGLNKIVEKYANNPNVIFIGIALDEDDAIENFIKLQPFNYRLVSGGRYYADKFNIKIYPTNVVVNKEGKVIFHSTGVARNTPDWIEKTIAESDNAKTP